MTFLLVDDSPTMRRIMRNALVSLGYEKFVEAGNGEEALKVMEENQDIDFIITDWNMPVMNGLEFVKKIRETVDPSNLPILMVTTRGNKEDVLQAVKAKVNNFVVKPFTPHTLGEKIDMILSKITK